MRVPRLEFMRSIKKCVRQKLRETGCLVHNRRDIPVRRRVRDEERILDAFYENTNNSVRRAAAPRSPLVSRPPPLATRRAPRAPHRSPRAGRRASRDPPLSLLVRSFAQTFYLRTR